MKFLKSQSGMSLIEVMVAVSILSVIMVSVMMLGKNMDKSAKNAEKKGDIESYMREITTLLADKESCSATFAGIAPTANATTQILSLKKVDENGIIVPSNRLRVNAIATGDTRNQVVINGMLLRHGAAQTPNGWDTELVVTFVKNPRAAGGNVTAQGSVMQNYVVKTIPVSLDNCDRKVAWAEQSQTLSCPAGYTAIGQVVTINSSGGASSGVYKMQACRSCAVRTNFISCH